MKGTLFLFIPHPSAFILALEPVAQMDESTGLRSLRAHVRVVPGSFADPESSKGRMPVFETGDEGSSPSSSALLRRKLNRHEHSPLKRGAAGSSPARRTKRRSVA